MDDHSAYESVIYGAAKIYVPMGTIFIAVGYGTMNIQLIMSGYVILLFVLYLHYILYCEIYRRN